MILCHIVGLDNINKDKFIIDVLNINEDVFILDLDDISNKIINFNKDFIVTYTNFIKFKHNIYFDSLKTIWKTHFFNNLRNILLDNKDKYIVLVGLNTFFLDFHTTVLLDSNLHDKFIISTHLDTYILEQTHSYEYDFDHNFDHNKFVKSQKDKLRDEYLVAEYKIIIYDDVIRFIKHKLLNLNNNSLNNFITNLTKLTDKNNKLTSLNIVYYASYNRYEDVLPKFTNLKNIIAYSEKWLALISLFSRNHFRRGVIKKDNEILPYIKEIAPLAMSQLNKCCYIYEFYPIEKLDDHRYLVEDMRFIKRYYVSNIKNDLLMEKVIFEKYDLTK